MFELNFNDVFIVLLLGIIVLLTLKCKNCSERFDPDDIYLHQNKGMESCKFSLDCCPSKYSNDQGCLCMDKNTSKEISSRGSNNSLGKKEKKINI